MDKKTSVKKEDFESYLEIQKSGVINMLDVKSGCEMTGLDKETWMDIIKNYTELKEEYKDVYDDVFNRNINI